MRVKKFNKIILALVGTFVVIFRAIFPPSMLDEGTANKEKTMKNTLTALAAALFAILLVFNAQAAQISWGINFPQLQHRLQYDKDLDTTLYMIVLGERSDYGDPGNYLSIHGIHNALEDRTFNAQTPGVAQVIPVNPVLYGKEWDMEVFVPITDFLFSPYPPAQYDLLLVIVNRDGEDPAGEYNYWYNDYNFDPETGLGEIRLIRFGDDDGKGNGQSPYMWMGDFIAGGASPTPIPEPATGVLVMGGTAIVLLRRRRRAA